MEVRDNLAKMELSMFLNILINNSCTFAKIKIELFYCNLFKSIYYYLLFIVIKLKFIKINVDPFPKET